MRTLMLVAALALSFGRAQVEAEVGLPDPKLLWGLLGLGTTIELRTPEGVAGAYYYAEHQGREILAFTEVLPEGSSLEITAIVLRDPELLGCSTSATAGVGLRASIFRKLPNGVGQGKYLQGCHPTGSSVRDPGERRGVPGPLNTTRRSPTKVELPPRGVAVDRGVRSRHRRGPHGGAAERHDRVLPPP